ncbi:alkaline phosphatase family protein [Methanolobus bombayensis]|uniref:alkaline phosphatase family protein n=1 Tax=Methanolobus bombayensis TaxID=38023 RepID=UPI001AE82517|nr:alkaline phosphatase family protein [Methanolobus bombayensis]MBP1910110.1 putative AlkP superfamily pyrophosphatase or phosphodiesterase [Methanolobus bombayensis]
MCTPRCSLADIAPTISRILAIPMVVPDGCVINDVADHYIKHDCKRVVLIIADSLGFKLYHRYESIMPSVSSLVSQGLLMGCSSVERHTSPCIASIFSGYLPENHHIHSTEDIYRERAKNPENPKIKTILEWAYDAGFKSAVVIESEGAETFRERVDELHGVKNSEDIIDYDHRIIKSAINTLSNEPDLLAVHLRSIDRYAHRSIHGKELEEAIINTDTNIGQIIEHAEKGTLFLICGDHTIHGWEKWKLKATDEEIRNHNENVVALIVGCK